MRNVIDVLPEQNPWSSPSRFAAMILEIDGEINPGLRAADQHTALLRRLERVRLVVDSSADQRTLASVADADSAGPFDRDVAGFRQLQQALKTRAPRNGQSAAGERHLRTGAGSPRWHVRLPLRKAGDAGR